MYQPTGNSNRSSILVGVIEKSDKFAFYERQVQRGNSDDSQRNGKHVNVKLKEISLISNKQKKHQQYSLELV